MDDESQVTSSTQESSEKAMEKRESRALELLSEGRKRMICCDYFGASLAFDEACNLLAEGHDEVDDALGEPYHLYGRCLLELARQENSVLGSGVLDPGEVIESSDEGEEEEEENAEEAEQEKVEEREEKEPLQDNNGPEGGERAEEPSSSCGDNAADVGASGIEAASNEASSSDAARTQPQDDKGQTTEEGEDPSTLQLAWEVLEVARMIFERQETHESRAQLADVCMTLGEVSLESDQYHRAIEDFTNCMKLREAVLSPSDRLLADAYYHLGLAFSLCNMMDEAIEEFNKARGVLELRKETLTNMLDGEKEEEEKERLREEIADLEDVLPDIIAKIVDSEDSRRVELSKKESGTSLEEEDSPPSHTALGGGADVPVNDISSLVRRKPADTSSGTASVDDQVTDISHLVRKKRPAEEGIVTNGAPSSKKAHLDGSSEEVVSSAQGD